MSCLDITPDLHACLVVIGCWWAVQELEATGNLNSFGGEIRVPSYRGSTFLDPKVPPCSCSCKLIVECSCGLHHVLTFGVGLPVEDLELAPTCAVS